MHRLAADGFNRRHVGVIDRVEDDHLVAGMNQRGNRGEQGLGRAGGDGDFAVDIVAGAIQRLDLGRDGGAQFGHAGERRVLVAAGEHVAMHGVEQRRLGLEIGKALRQVHRAAIGSELGHHGENGRPHLREAGGNLKRGVHGQFHGQRVKKQKTGKNHP